MKRYLFNIEIFSNHFISPKVVWYLNSYRCVNLPTTLCILPRKKDEAMLVYFLPLHFQRGPAVATSCVGCGVQDLRIRTGNWSLRVRRTKELREFDKSLVTGKVWCSFLGKGEKSLLGLGSRIPQWGNSYSRVFLEKEGLEIWNLRDLTSNQLRL